MGISSKEKIIDDCKVTVMQFGGRKGLKYKLRLIKLLGPVVTGLLSDIKTEKGLKVNVKDLLQSNMDLSKIGKAIEHLLNSADDDKTFELMIDLLSATTIDGRDLSKDVVFDDIFSNNYGLLYKVLFFVLEVNYSNLFNLGDIGKLTEEILNQTVSPENMKK